MPSTGAQPALQRPRADRLLVIVFRVLELGHWFARLDAAITATFERRQTAIPTARPPGLSAEMVDDEVKQRQWRAYAASVELENVSLESIVDEVWALVGPSSARIVAKAAAA